MCQHDEHILETLAKMKKWLGKHLPSAEVVAIQKKAPDYNPDRGAKWPLTSLRRYLCQTRGEDATEIAFKRVNDVFWYSLQAVQGINFKIKDRSLIDIIG